ncbi:udp-glycosyltransferase 91c1 [Nicotiana attenuata]|uniref:Udp-glycosyltransferase 91c1 n=1 Tax=Nicotiana attenuata TaxID=49451 RepID=A0A1J6KX71_NICAT|nr:udp-glycosyltransferase 91c1 [Nicotiana attenuata]
MVPWLAFGHLQPFFQLSMALAKEKVHVSFLSTPKNIKRLPKLPSNLALVVNLVEFPLPLVDGSPLLADAEASVDVSADQMLYLHQAFNLLQELVKNFIADKRPDWVIADFILDWVTDIAPPKPRAQPIQVKNGSRPLHELLTSPRPWVDFPSMVSFRKYDALDLISVLRGENESRETLLGHDAVIEGACRAMAIRTCMEFEGDYLDTYNKIVGKLVIPIGFLPPKELPPNER